MIINKIQSAKYQQNKPQTQFKGSHISLNLEHFSIPLAAFDDGGLDFLTRHTKAARDGLITYRPDLDIFVIKNTENTFFMPHDKHIIYTERGKKKKDIKTHFLYEENDPAQVKAAFVDFRNILKELGTKPLPIRKRRSLRAKWDDFLYRTVAKYMGRDLP